MSNRVMKKLYGDSDPVGNGGVGGGHVLVNRTTTDGGGGRQQLSQSDSDSHNDNSGGSGAGGGGGGGGLSSAKGQQRSKKLAINRFELLNSLDHNSMSDTEAKEDDDKDNDSVRNWCPMSEKISGVTIGGSGGGGGGGGGGRHLEKQDSTQSTDSLKKKRKKKKKIRSQKSLDGYLDANGGAAGGYDDDEDIDATVEEVNRMLGSSGQLQQPANDPMTSSGIAGGHHRSYHHSSKAAPPKKSLISVEARHLNPENEMKRIFGSKVILAEQNSARRRGRHRHTIGRTWILVNPKNWANVGKCGLTMEYVDKVNADNGSGGGYLRFNIVHSRSYQTVQFAFMDAVDSYNPDNLVAILNAHPYHIDTLIQFSDVCRMAEDNQMAAELIERALYCIEHTFHPLFNITQANCRLDYRRPENRAFYIALFKHLTFVGQRGCNRTALEFCKLILSLDPEGDPLAVLLMIDFYALRCEQYDYLLTLNEEWESTKKLSLFPNFRYSTSLALYYMSQKTPELTDRADQHIQEALIMFPAILPELLEKCSVEPDPQVARCDYFQYGAQKSMTPAIKQLNTLYIGRTYLLWKDRSIMSWLERNVRQVIERVANNDPFVNLCSERRKQYLSGGTPRNVLRHVILSGIKDAQLALPNDLAKDSIFGYDPLPPTDSIVSYSRPKKPAGAQQSTTAGAGAGSAADDQSLLSVFLRSWLPNFNAEELAAAGGADGAVVGGAVGAGGVALRNRAMARQLERQLAEDDVMAAGGGGAQRPAAAAVGDTTDLRRSVTSLLDAMRDLLSNIHMADVPNEGDISSEDQEDDPHDD